MNKEAKYDVHDTMMKETKNEPNTDGMMLNEMKDEPNTDDTW